MKSDDKHTNSSKSYQQGCRGYGNPHTHGNGNMIFSCGDPHMDLHMGIHKGISIWDPHRGKSYSYSQPNSMVMGIHMGISVWISIRISQYGSPYPWNCVENRNMIFSCGDLHMDIPIWGYTYEDPHGDSQ